MDLQHRTASLPEDGKYRILVDAVTDYAIFLLDADGTVTSWNSGAQRIKGYVAAEILGQHFSRFYTDEDRLAGRPALALQTAARVGRFEAEGWRLRKDGTRFWAHVVIDAVRDPSGAVVGFAKVTRDLTERKAAEESLRRSEEQFNLLVQSVTDYAIYRLDAQGRVTNWNLGAQRIKGYAPAEVIGSHFSRFYTDEDRARGAPERALETAAREGRFESEGWRVRKDGSRFWANAVIDPIRDAGGALLGFAKVTRDITEKRETQRQLEIARESLFQSQKMDAIGQLTGGIAHDFNNLLMAVLGSLALVRKRVADDPQVLALVENAIRGAKRGTALTQRMLAFARKQTLKPVAVDVPGLVHGMSGLLQSSLGPSVTIETRFPEGLPPVKVDANQLELALLNLAVNGRDAMPHGGIIVIAAVAAQVTVDHGVKLTPGAYVCLTVTDSGDGMDPPTLARAVEPFYTTKGVGKGTGLGLPMVDGLAAQSGGRFVLTSQPGVGTTAALWLPVAAPGTASTVDAETAPLAAREATRPLVVLAVDDDPLVLNNTAAMLQDLGHTVFEAASGKEALELLEREPGIDLLVTDQAMPQMTGAELMAAARERRRHLPTVLATGYAELAPGPAIQAVRLAKPFEQDALAHAIVQALAAEPKRSG